MCVCLSVPRRIPTLLHGPGCNLKEWWGCPLVVHYWAYLHLVHRLRCCDNDNIAPNAKCQRVLVLALCLVVVVTARCFCCVRMQGNFCVYKVSEDDAIISTSDKSNKPAITETVAGEETQADDEKEDENKIDNKLKLSVGLPTNYAIEVKVMVYIIRVCQQHVYSLFGDIYDILTVFMGSVRPIALMW